MELLYEQMSRLRSLELVRGEEKEKRNRVEIFESFVLSSTVCVCPTSRINVSYRNVIDFTVATRGDIRFLVRSRFQQREADLWKGNSQKESDTNEYTRGYDEYRHIIVPYYNIYIASVN